jgi:hypothetical protein
MFHDVRGHGDDRQRLETGAATQFAGRTVAVHDRHLDVHQHQIESARVTHPEAIDRFLAVAGHHRRDADRAEQGFDDLAVERMIIDDQYPRAVIALPAVAAAPSMQGPCRTLPIPPVPARA